jgi:hypothetical protein
VLDDRDGIGRGRGFHQAQSRERTCMMHRAGVAGDVRSDTVGQRGGGHGPSTR